MIRVGQVAAQDPVLNFTSAVATQLLRQASARPAAQRLDWLRAEMNKATTGMGDDFVSKTRELRRRGRSQDQAVFDALRLVLANKIAVNLPAKAAEAGMAGLGTSERDISATFCGINGTVGGVGVIVTAAMENPAGTGAVGEAMASILQSQGCSSGAMEQQQALLQAQLLAMQQQQGLTAGVTASTGALPWILAGVVGLGLLGTVGYLVVKKK